MITVGDEDGETYSLTDDEIKICMNEITRWEGVRDVMRGKAPWL